MFQITTQLDPSFYFFSRCRNAVRLESNLKHMHLCVQSLSLDPFMCLSAFNSAACSGLARENPGMVQRKWQHAKGGREGGGGEREKTREKRTYCTIERERRKQKKKKKNTVKAWTEREEDKVSPCLWGREEGGREGGREDLSFFKLLAGAAARRLVAPPSLPPPTVPSSRFLLSSHERRGRQTMVCFTEPLSLSVCAAVWKPQQHTHTHNRTHSSSHARYILRAFKVARVYIMHRKGNKGFCCRFSAQRIEKKIFIYPVNQTK